MKKITKLKLILALSIVPVSVVFATVDVLLYKHHTISELDWKNTSGTNNALIDPNGDGDYADSTWTSPADAQDPIDHVPTTPTFSAEVFDATNASLGTL